MPSLPSELHSATSTSSPLNSSNISNVNRFHSQSTTNFVTPVQCNSSSSASTRANCSKNTTNSFTNSSLTPLTSVAQVSPPFLDLHNSSAADIAVAAAAKVAYDFAGLTAAANFHRSHTQSHPSVSTASSSVPSFPYFGDCGVDSFTNGLTSWEAAHQSAAAFAATSHHYSHQLPTFSPHCDIRSAFTLSVPSTSTNCTVSSVPAMTVQKVAENVRPNSCISNSILNQNSNSLSNGISTNFPLTSNSIPNKTSKPRRRVATVAQRRAANIRERRRMFNLNSAFDKLRRKVPTFAYEKRLSRIETLRLAIMYIRFMTEVIRGKDSCFEPRMPLHPSGTFQNHHRERDHLWNGNNYPFNSFSDSIPSSRY